MQAKLVPELNVSNLEQSLAFYCGIIGFRVLFDRPDEKFAYLDLDGAELMLEEVTVPYSSGRAMGAEAPVYGRVMHLEQHVPDLDAVYERVLLAGMTVLVPMQERRYRTGQTVTPVRQFVVADPDGFVIRPQKTYASVQANTPSSCID